jgi:hypothetical protein
VNDLEHRLPALLRDATAGTGAAPGAVPAALRHAGRIRRRRAAAGGVVGAAAVAATAATALLPRPDRGTVTPAASATASPAVTASAAATASPAATAAADRTTVVTVRRSACHETLPSGSKVCVRTRVAASGAGIEPEEFEYYEGYGDGQPVLEAPVAEIGVRYADGTTSRAPAHPDGEGGWYADVPAPPGAVVREITLYAAGGDSIITFAEEPGQD